MDLVSWTIGGTVRNPDEPLLIDALSPSNSLSFSQIKRKVRQLIRGLQASGVREGDCVCVNCFNDLQYSVLYLGIIGSGAAFTGVNPAYTTHELVHHFELTRPKVVIVEPPMLEKTLAAAEQIGLAGSNIFVFDTETPNTNSGLQSWTTLLERGESDWVTVADPDITPATYNSTSGTSGLPKAAMISHSYHVTQSEARCNVTPYKQSRLLALPPFHAFASPILPSSIHAGIPTYIMRRFAEAPFLTSISLYDISEIYVPPPVLMRMHKSEFATKEGLRSLRSIWMGGASVKYSQQKPLYDMLHPDAVIRQVWGMTEAGWVTTVHDTVRREDDSVGQPVEGFELTIVNTETDEPIVGDYEAGEIIFNAPHLLLSYIDNPTATTAAFSPCGRYLRSGDIGYRVTSASGVPSIYIIDRAKELIKVRGWQVSPTEIESELLQHPCIADAAAIGIKEANGVDEFIRAYIVRRGAEQEQGLLDAASLREWLRGRLSGYKVPAELCFVDKVPRNSTGKILRRVLRGEGAKLQKPYHTRTDSALSIVEAFVPPAEVDAEVMVPEVAPLEQGREEPVKDDQKLLSWNSIFTGIVVCWCSSIVLTRVDFGRC
ncbi:uncharacterized protein K452DRAFT_248860 [Aplosporella prunicola CBS 121167]|uniref:AMP-dependent synthetase/ligase domain-containing protein n=1 Tax=Aplosporella prunicola CBS 121167 TaxID=1176127 RepID=A0A6A6BIL0_9PEZI|nr:uncharacterized protein K452DRAFT_248860 [Aplosporella prunicola CBS 121167]KAF2143094.1 hypothetical protein K452DRAFT_248860 [Aplosporella prunicola CBS 121167]